MPNLYCYADESGQETHGRLFVVASAVFGSDHEALCLVCEQYEAISGKGKAKWGHTKHKARMVYIRSVFQDNRFKGRLRFTVFYNTHNLDAAMVKSIAGAVKYEVGGAYSAHIYVDALSKTKRREYLRDLRLERIKLDNVRGIAKDENNACIRLADALAGFVRDSIDNPETEIGKLFHEAVKAGTIIEV
jgi:hypothetical protein